MDYQDEDDMKLVGAGYGYCDDDMKLVGAGYGYCGGLIGTYVCPSLMELEGSVLPPDLLNLMLSYVDYFWWVSDDIRCDPFPWADDWRSYGDY